MQELMPDFFYFGFCVTFLTFPDDNLFLTFPDDNLFLTFPDDNLFLTFPDDNLFEMIFFEWCNSIIKFCFSE